MTRVLKYQLMPGVTHLQVPQLAKPLFVHDQRDQLYLWIECSDDGRDTEIRAFEVVATGEHFWGGTYIGTATMDDASLIWHVYEVPA